MKHMKTVSRLPVIATTQPNPNETLQLIVDVMEFAFTLLGAKQEAFSTILDASLSFKETLQGSNTQ